jgi:hypothetical protein
MTLENAALDPGFFSGRYLVEITTWEPDLHVGLPPPTLPKKYRFQGGLIYSKGITIEGQVAAPVARRGQRVEVRTLALDPDVRFKARGAERVGCFSPCPPQRGKPDFDAMLLMPTDAVPFVAISLISSWKYLHIWTIEDDSDDWVIRDYAFSSSLHENLEPWVAGEI